MRAAGESDGQRHHRDFAETTIMDSVRENNLSAWLVEQEEKPNIVLYQCDQFLTPWSFLQRGIRQAKNILIVVLASKDPSLSLIEEELEPIAVRTQKYLIL